MYNYGDKQTLDHMAEKEYLERRGNLRGKVWFVMWLELSTEVC